MMKGIILMVIVILKPISYELKTTFIQKSPSKLKTGWYYVTDKKNFYSRQLSNSNEKYFIDPQPIVLANHFSKVEIESNNYNGKSNQYILIKFDQIGTDAWSKATEKAMNKKLALIIDDDLVYAPEVESIITVGISALNRGSYSKEELEKFAKIIKLEM